MGFFVLEVKLGCIWLDILEIGSLNVHRWVREIWNIDRRCETTLLWYFIRYAWTWTESFIENVEEKLRKRGKQTSVPLETKMAIM